MPDAKILIVEDEAIEAMDIQQRLAGLGYPLPDIAHNGEEGVRKVEEAQPDLVLMDIMMPGKLDGVAAAERIRSRFDIPIIFLTAYADENTLRRAKVTSPYGYIVKPFQERELHITVELALYRHETEKKLKQTNAELEAVNSELEAFIYSVSHDLRAPLRAISNFAKLLAEEHAGGLDAKGQDYLDRVYKGTDRMSVLIEALLHLSRLSRKEVDRREFDISEKASSVVAALRELSPGRSVEIIIQDGLNVSADPGLTDIVLTNLLGNAWKFTSRTENARIEFGAVDRDGTTVYFVRDNGAGFDPCYSSRLFMPFQRLHMATEFPGTGVGLATVKRIIDRHGGSIRAEGVPDKGATFFFSLG